MTAETSEMTYVLLPQKKDSGYGPVLLLGGVLVCGYLYLTKTKNGSSNALTDIVDNLGDIFKPDRNGGSYIIVKDSNPDGVPNTVPIPGYFDGNGHFVIPVGPTDDDGGNDDEVPVDIDPQPEPTPDPDPTPVPEPDHDPVMISDNKSIVKEGLSVGTDVIVSAVTAASTVDALKSKKVNYDPYASEKKFNSAVDEKLKAGKTMETALVEAADEAADYEDNIVKDIAKKTKKSEIDVKRETQLIKERALAQKATKQTVKTTIKGTASKLVPGIGWALAGVDVALRSYNPDDGSISVDNVVDSFVEEGKALMEYGQMWVDDPGQAATLTGEALGETAVDVFDRVSFTPMHATADALGMKKSDIIQMGLDNLGTAADAVGSALGDAADAIGSFFGGLFGGK